MQTTEAAGLSPSHAFHTFGDGEHLPDVTLQSSDGVEFHAHSHVLRRASTNGFGTVLPASPCAPARPDNSHSLPAAYTPLFSSPMTSFFPIDAQISVGGGAGRDLSRSIPTQCASTTPCCPAEVSAHNLCGRPPGKGALHLHPRPPVLVPNKAAVLHVILSAVYSLPIAHDTDWDTLSAALEALVSQYAIPVSVYASASSPLFRALIAHAHARPLDVYALAAECDAEDVAVAASQYLLSLQLQDIPAAWEARVGPLYIQRLFVLFLSRERALRQIVLAPPALHVSSECRSACVISREWALVAAQVVLDARYAPARLGTYSASSCAIVQARSPAFGSRGGVCACRAPRLVPAVSR